MLGRPLKLRRERQTKGLSYLASALMVGCDVVPCGITTELKRWSTSDRPVSGSASNRIPGPLTTLTLTGQSRSGQAGDNARCLPVSHIDLPLYSIRTGLKYRADA